MEQKGCALAVAVAAEALDCGLFGDAAGAFWAAADAFPECGEARFAGCGGDGGGVVYA